jgi:hypothetical protein
MAQQPLAGQDLLVLEASTSHLARRTTVGRITGIVIRQTLRLPDNTQHSQQTDIQAPGRILTRNPKKETAAEPRLKPCGRRDRLLSPICRTNEVISNTLQNSLRHMSSSSSSRTSVYSMPVSRLHIRNRLFLYNTC